MITSGTAQGFALSPVYPIGSCIDFLYSDSCRREAGADTPENAMSIDVATLVPVRCAWNAWQTAEVRLGDLEGIHWYQPTGAPRPLVHAYVDCTKTRGQIAHDHQTTPGPHRLLVCVLKRHAAPPAYSELVRLAASAA